MLKLIIFASQCFFLGSLFWQDMRGRSIYVWTLLGLLFSCLFCRIGWDRSPDIRYWQLLEQTGLNLLLIAVHLVSLGIYFSLKENRWIWPVGTLLGWGDVLFWMVGGLYFSLPDFLFFLLASLIFSLMTHGLLRLLLHPDRYSASVPLAGLQALWMMATLLVDHWQGLVRLL